MEQIRVSELASEFEMKNSLVIAELKKIGVWVPSADTPVDQDIADRIRRRLQMILDLEEQEQERDKKEKQTSTTKAKTRKTIKELGQPRKRAAKTTDEPKEHQISPLTSSLKPRKGKASYRRAEAPPEEVRQKIEVTIDDEPIIQRVEAQVSPEVLEKAAAKLQEITEKKEVERGKPGAPPRRIKRKVTRPAPAEAKPAHAPRAAAARTEEGVEEKPGPAVPIDVKAKPAREAEAASAKPVPDVAGAQTITLPERISIKDLGEKLRVKSGEIIKVLMGMGVMANVNQILDPQLVQEICRAFGFHAIFSAEGEPVVEEKAPPKVKKEKKIVEAKPTPEHLVERAPVVTVMGHVDHGKTSLLDAIRKTHVAEGEAGGITQHIGAYQVEVQGRRIAFIDTPGHEAFTRMRARGAQVTDVVILVVAADDGVMPQTIEAIDHARAAGVPIVVAINKIDKPEAQPQRVRKALSERGLMSEEWGGDTVMVEVSAQEKTNLDLLLEMILLTADLLELKANPDKAAAGVVLEAKLERGRGPIATLLVQAGTLKIGDSVVCGVAYGKVRAMFDDRGNSIPEAGPSTAVEILGLQTPPQAGDTFEVIEEATRARGLAEARQSQIRERDLQKSARTSLEDLYAQMQEGEVKELRVVLKADAQGSIEVLEDTLEKLSTGKVHVKIIHRGVGAVSESDVLLASASDAIVIGFNVRPERAASDAAEKEGVDIRLHTIIYEVINEMKQAMTGLLEPTIKEAFLGRAEVRNTFRVPKFGAIAGTYIQEGSVRRNAHIRLLRDNVVIHEGKIDSLRRFKEDVNEVKSGYECGVSIANFNDVKVGDIIEAFTREEVAATLD